MITLENDLQDEEDAPLGRFFSAEEIRTLAERTGNGVKTTVLRLDRGDSAADLASTKGKRIWGPSVVTVAFWPDGGVDTIVRSESEMTDKMRRMYVDAESAVDRLAVAAGRLPQRKKGVTRKDPKGTDAERFRVFGESKTLRTWAVDKRCRVDLDTLRRRVRNLGWDIERALTTAMAGMSVPFERVRPPENTGSVGRNATTYEAFGRRRTLQQWGEITGFRWQSLATDVRENSGDLETALRRRGWPRPSQ